MQRARLCKQTLWAAALLAAVPFSVGGAAGALQNQLNIPNSGSLLSELEPQRQVAPKPSQPKIDMTVPKNKQLGQEMTAYVRKVIFTCPDLDINEQLQFLTEGKLKKPLTFAQMEELAVRATEELRRQGYSMALVYVPAQELDRGVLILKAVIGRYGDVEIVNHSQLTNERLLGYTYPIRPGQLIKSQPLDKSLLILNEIPGVQVKASLVPGKIAGTAKIIIAANTLEKQGGYLYLDDYGSKSTGKWRYGLNYYYNNLSKVGDQIDLSYLTSFSDLQNYQISYTLPVGRDGALTHLSYSHMNYNLGNRWSYLHGDGLANTLELGVTVPMKHSLRYSSWYDLTYRNRALHDDLFDSMLDSKKSSNVVQGEIHGYVRENKYSTTYSLSHAVGKLSLDSDYAKNTDLLGTEGWFAKTNASLYHIQQLNDRWQLHAVVNAQYAHDNLDSSEDFYLTGPNGVRAFPQGESGGDSGLLGTLELRYQTGCPGLILAAFVDGGRVFYNKDGIAEDTSDNVRNLAGTGLSMIYVKPRNWFAKLDWATPLGDHYSSSENEKIHNTWWFRLVKEF